MKTTLRISTPLAILPALLLAACASTPHWDRESGDTVRAALTAQIANPAAAQNANPVAGIDGRAARAAQERYEKSYKQAQEQTTSVPAPMISNK